MTSKYTVEQLRRLICTAKDLNEPLNYLFNMVNKQLLQSAVITDLDYVEVKPIVHLIEDTLNEDLDLQISITTSLLEQTLDKKIIHGVCDVSGELHPVRMVYSVEDQTLVMSFLYNQRVELWKITRGDTPAVEE